MNISDIIAKTEISEKEKKYLGQIVQYPELCTLLQDYYLGIKILKPVKAHQTVDKEKLTIILFSTFEKLAIQIKLLKENGIHVLVAELLFAIRLQHLKEFGNKSSMLDEPMNKLIKYYSKLIKADNNDFTCLLLAKINLILPESKAAKPEQKLPYPNCIAWGGDNFQKKELERRLNNTDWFTRPVDISFFFNTSNNYPVLFCRPNRIGHLALLLRMLYEANLIEAELGKCYMKMAARHIVCNGRIINERLLSKMSCEILAGPIANAHIIEPVSAIVEKVKKAKNGGRPV